MPSYIASFPRFGREPGLAPMRALMRRLGDPQKSLRFVHIAGTNGKGSITTMTAAILQAAGCRTGSYTSPYVLDFRERMQIDGQWISEKELAAVIERLRPAADDCLAEGHLFSQFDLVTAAALCWFADRRCDVVCLEVGLGGRFDATNVIDGDCCAAAVIAAIGLDHTELLGDTVEKIAFEKCGIVKQGTDVVCYPLQPDGALAVIMETVADMGGRLYLPAVGVLRDESADPLHPAFSFGGESYTLRLLGRHQLYNAVTVLETVGVLRRKGFRIPQEAVRQGLASAFLPARLQLLGERPLLLLDGAHNPHGSAALAEFLSALQKAGYRIALVIGMLADKDAASSVAALTRHCAAAAAVPVHNPRALPLPDMLSLLTAYCPVTSGFESISDAIVWAGKQAGRNGVVVIGGSLYLAGEVLAAGQSAWKHTASTDN